MIVTSGEYQSIAADVKLGKDVRLSKFINLYGCQIGDETKVGAFVEIQKIRPLGGDARFPATLLFVRE